MKLVATDLASRANGGSVLSAADEFFVPKESLILDTSPVSRKGGSSPRGGLYDGWETRRRRDGGSDWVVVRLGMPGVVEQVIVDTAFFRGNYPESITLEVLYHLGYPTAEELDASSRWQTVVTRGACAGDSKNTFTLDVPTAATHVRLWIHPDGGVARLRVLGHVLADPRVHPRVAYDLAAQENGGQVVGQSDDFFNPASNVIRRGVASTTKDGWETQRRRGRGHDWLEVRLAAESLVYQFVVDTSCFIGNSPLEGAIRVSTEKQFLNGSEPVWTTAVGRRRLLPDQIHNESSRV